MRRVAPLILLVLGCQKDRAPTPAEVTDRAWRAHAEVVAAGEAAKTCAEAGAAMQREFVARRQAFVDAMALDRDKAKLEEATDFIEKNEGRYLDLETRMTALSERCADEPTVQAAFAQMSNP
ncbi:MAG: hypothetical protein AB7T06_27400 [Kofleriaceae bacterium]